MPLLNVKDLLLAPRLDRERVRELLAPYGFKAPSQADTNLQDMAREPSERHVLAELLGTLLSCIAQSANPDQSLNYLERFAQASGNRMRLFSYLRDAPVTLEVLAKTLGASPYMADIL